MGSFGVWGNRLTEKAGACKKTGSNCQPITTWDCLKTVHVLFIDIKRGFRRNVLSGAIYGFFSDVLLD